MSNLPDKPSLTDLVANHGDWENIIESFAKACLRDTPWSEKGIRITSKADVIFDMPMKCNPFTCRYRQKCEVIRGMSKEQKEMLVDTDCRSEMLFAVRKFTEYVSSLDVDPGASSDIAVVSSLVRLEILRRRIDWDIAIQGLVDTKPVVGRDGKVREERVEHPLLKSRKSIEEQIAKQLRMLLATRADKLKIQKEINMQGKVLLSIVDLVPDNHLPEFIDVESEKSGESSGESEDK